MKLPKSILDIITANKTSLGDNPALPPELDEKFLVFLVNDYYSSLLKHFDTINIDELAEDLSETMTECKKIESEHIEALEKLCFNIVNAIFRIPSGTLSIDMKLVNKVDVDNERLIPENSKKFSFENISEIKHITGEIYKRRLLNSLIIGAAMYYAENIHSYTDELGQIDKRLPLLYKKITCINNLLLFHTKQLSANKQMDGGRVDVYISGIDAPVQINAQGVLFPILLEETIRGILELSISHGLPAERNVAEYITSKTDFKLAEVWDQRLGLPLWQQILKVMKESDIDPLDVGLNFIFMELSQFKPKHFNVTMQEIFADTRSGRQIVKKITDSIYRQKELDDFNDYILTQTSNKKENPLNDEEQFTSDDLINDDLCSSVILDEEDN